MSTKRDSSSAPLVIVYLIRLLGVVVLLVGLATSIKVLERAWGLLEDHRTVVELSEAIDKQSGLSNFFGESASRLGGLMGAGREFTDQSQEETKQPRVDVPSRGDVPSRSADAAPLPAPTLKPSYFMAWPLAILVLFLVARIALSLVMTGANLALRAASGDDQIRALVNELVKEIRTSRDEPLGRQ